MFRLFNAPGSAGDDDDVDNASGEGSGVHMYGAVIMVLHKHVVVDPIMSQGYRLISDKVWRIEAVAGNRTILGISDTQASELSILSCE